MRLFSAGSHENIVGYYTSWFENEQLYIQMELCDQSLSIHRSSKLWTEREALEAMHQVSIICGTALLISLTIIYLIMRKGNPGKENYSKWNVVVDLSYICSQWEIQDCCNFHHIKVKIWRQHLIFYGWGEFVPPCTFCNFFEFPRASLFWHDKFNPPYYMPFFYF